jgi:hypothetical protein
MLAEFEEMEARFGADKGAELRKACRYLIRHQFIYAGDRGVSVIYDIVMDGRFRGLIDDFFDCMGYKVLRDQEEQWTGIILHDEEMSSTPKMRVDETIVLLVAAAHWQDEANQGNVEDRATVLTTFNALYDKYKEMTQGAVRVPLSTSKFTDILREMSARNLLWIGEQDKEMQDREIVLRPMIKLVSGSDMLKRIEDHVKTEDYLTPADDQNSGEEAEMENA